MFGRTDQCCRVAVGTREFAHSVQSRLVDPRPCRPAPEAAAHRRVATVAGLRIFRSCPAASGARQYFVGLGPGLLLRYQREWIGRTERLNRGVGRPRFAAAARTAKSHPDHARIGFAPQAKYRMPARHLDRGHPSRRRRRSGCPHCDTAHLTRSVLTPEIFAVIARTAFRGHSIRTRTTSRNPLVSGVAAPPCSSLTLPPASVRWRCRLVRNCRRHGNRRADRRVATLRASSVGAVSRAACAIRN